MTDDGLAEHIRALLPAIAGEVRPGELVRVWIERAARATGLSAGRLRAYWHRKVEAPKASEYLAVVAAAECAARRRQAIAELERDIAARAATLDFKRIAHLPAPAERPRRSSERRRRYG